jgi:hypothetical protein
MAGAGDSLGPKEAGDRPIADPLQSRRASSRPMDLVVIYGAGSQETNNTGHGFGHGRTSGTGGPDRSGGGVAEPVGG